MGSEYDTPHVTPKSGVPDLAPRNLLPEFDSLHSEPNTTNHSIMRSSQSEQYWYSWYILLSLCLRSMGSPSSDMQCTALP